MSVKPVDNGCKDILEKDVTGQGMVDCLEDY